MANINVNIDQLIPQGGADNLGRRISIFNTIAKVAQNDTITFLGANSVSLAFINIKATGVSEPHTIVGNVITLTSVTVGPVSGIVVYN